MGSVGREIVGEEAVGRIVDDLNRALAAEVNDAYRYLLLSQLAAGVHAGEAAEFFARTAQDEWGHVAIMMERITQLGGRPAEGPGDAVQATYAEYRPPPKDETDVRTMLEDSLEGERAAIRFYKDLFDGTRDVDPITAEIARAALADEVSDEDEIERMLAHWPDGS